jgi:hypothetical protein
VTPPTFSILTRTTGRTELAAAIDSIADQRIDRGEFELVLVNDGGPSISELATDARRRMSVELVEHPVSVGKSAAINSGFDASRGRYLCILDDDDLFYPSHLEVLLESIKRDPEVEVRYTDTDIAVAPPGEERRIIGTQSWEFDRGELMMMRTAPIACSICIRREAWSQVGGFDEQFRSVLDDWDFYMRLSETCRFVRVPGITSQYTQPPGNKSFERFLAYEAGVARIRAHLVGTSTPLRTEAALDEAMDRMRRDYALAERDFQIEELRSQTGAKPQDTALVDPRASFRSGGDRGPVRIKALSTSSFEVEVVNRGTERWCSNGGLLPVFLSYHWRSERGGHEIWDGVRTPLPRDVAAGESLAARVLVHAPETPGPYRWSPALVQEGVQWFEPGGRGEDGAHLMVHVDR